MSINYYCKIVKKDKSEVLASIDCSFQVRDYVMNNSVLANYTKDELEDFPKFAISKKEKDYFVGILPVDVLHDELDKLNNKLKNKNDKLKLLEMTSLAAKTKIALEDIKMELDSMKMLIEIIDSDIAALSELSTIVSYELNSRTFYKNNKPINRENCYKYRKSEDYDLYFFYC